MLALLVAVKVDVSHDGKGSRTLTRSPKPLTNKQLAVQVATPLVQLVEHGSSCAKVMCLIPRERKYC